MLPFYDELGTLFWNDLFIEHFKSIQYLVLQGELEMRLCRKVAILS